MRERMLLKLLLAIWLLLTMEEKERKGGKDQIPILSYSCWTLPFRLDLLDETCCTRFFLFIFPFFREVKIHLRAGLVKLVKIRYSERVNL